MTDKVFCFKVIMRCFKRLSTTWYLFFLILHIYITTFVFVLPWFCQDLGFSLYYNSAKHSKEKIDKINHDRTLKAYESLRKLQNYEHSLEISSIDDLIAHEELKIAFVVVTVQRTAKPHYLPQVVSRLLHQTTLSNSLKWKAKIIVFNADNNPSVNEDAKFISKYVTVVNRQMFSGKVNISSFDVYEKEKVDYMLALQIGVQLNAEYTVIIEDDALPNTNFLQNLRFLITWKIPWLRSSPEWAFLKLYYPEKWQGYGNTEIQEIVIIFLMGGIIPSYLYTKMIKSKPKTGIIAMVFLTCGVYFMSVAYCIGRAHLLELGKVLPIFHRVTEAPNCCTPAVLFPKSHIEELVAFLMKSKCHVQYPLDFALDDFVSHQKLVKYLASPNLVSHIGFHSSLNKADKDLREFSLLFDP